MQKLIDACFQQDDKLYLCVSSPTIKDKPVSFFALLLPKYAIGILVTTNGQRYRQRRLKGISMIRVSGAVPSV